MADAMESLRMRVSEAEGWVGAKGWVRADSVRELPEGCRGQAALFKPTSMSAWMRRVGGLRTPGMHVELGQVTTPGLLPAAQQQPWNLHHSVNNEGYHCRNISQGN
jgi:hypothetical protein